MFKIPNAELQELYASMVSKYLIQLNRTSKQ
jgi:hypothetical protein